MAIHQPQFFPYPGFFHKLSLADAFVIMDDVQYDKRYTNRNQILAPQGPMWLTVPIDKEDKLAANKSVRINNAMPWREDHWKKITYFYKNSRWFRLYGEFLEGLYRRQHELLFEFDLETTTAVMKWLGIDIPTVRESELSVAGEGTRRLVNVCKAMGADTYVSGPGGRNYMDERQFAGEGVKLEYQRYSALPYPQRFSEAFVPNMSILDMLFNVGPGSRELVRGVAQADLVS